MTIRRGLILLALLAGIAFPAQAEEVALTDLYKNLAEKNNYPAVKGLRGAKATVKCNIWDQVVGAFPEAAGQPIAVTYSWSRPSEDAWPEKKFTVSGIPSELADLANRANMIFQGSGQQDFVIEDPVYWTISLTEAPTAVEQGGTIMVSGDGEQVKNLSVEIDGATFKVNKLTMSVGGNNVTIETTREDMGGIWVIKSLLLANGEVTRRITYEYTQVDGFNLPSKMEVEYPGTDEPTFVYEFEGWEVDKTS